MGLSFKIAAGPRQRSHSRVRVPRDSWPHSRPPNWRARSPYLYPRGTGWPSYTPRHWVPFSSPPTTRRATVEVLDPHLHTGLLSQLARVPRCMVSGWTQQGTPYPSLWPNNTSIVAYVFVAAGTCLPSRCRATDVYSGSIVPAFKHHVTIQ
jgi:hypothetical protein